MRSRSTRSQRGGGPLGGAGSSQPYGVFAVACGTSATVGVGDVHKGQKGFKRCSDEEYAEQAEHLKALLDAARISTGYLSYPEFDWHQREPAKPAIVVGRVRVYCDTSGDAPFYVIGGVTDSARPHFVATTDIDKAIERIKLTNQGAS